MLTALEAGTPPPAAEVASIFRRLCEALARDKPLVLVFDDVHWAEPTFLDGSSYVADRGEGPILVVCLAREELLEERPAFLEGGTTSSGSCSIRSRPGRPTHSSPASAARSSSPTSEPDRRAGGREPFFLEQLLALALEGGLAEHALPATVQALLATRLDRLGPGERAVLERGAVIATEFSADDVISLMEPDAAPRPQHISAPSRAASSGRPTRRLRLPPPPRPGGGLPGGAEAAARRPPRTVRDRLDRAMRTCPSSTSSPATTSSRPTACAPSSESRTGGRHGSPRTGEAARSAGTRAWKRNDVHATVGLLRPGDCPPAASDDRRREAPLRARPSPLRHPVIRRSDSRAGGRNRRPVGVGDRASSCVRGSSSSTYGCSRSPA